MKRSLLPLFTAAFLFACSAPTSDNKEGSTNGNNGEAPAHTEGDGHDHGTSAHDSESGHSHDDGHVHSESAPDTTGGHSHGETHNH